jgi:hypothetical protein
VGVVAHTGNQEVEIRRVIVQGQPKQKVNKIPISTNESFVL